MPSLLPYTENRCPKGLSHRVPLLLPGLLAIVGATYPYRALKFLAMAAILVLPVLVLRIGMDIYRNIRRNGCPSTRLNIQPKIRLSSRTNIYPDIHPNAHLLAVLPLVLAASCLIMGIARGLVWYERIRRIEEMARPGISVKLTVIPLEEPRPDPYGSRHSFRALACSPERSRPGWFGVLASVYPRDISKITPGSSVDCRAALDAPSPAMNPGGFCYRGYLLGERIVALAAIQEVLGPAARMGRPLFLAPAIKVMASMRSYMARAIDSSFPREDAALLKAVFLGDRGELDPEDSRDFKRSGFYRFVGICGFHVDLLFGLVERSLRRLTKRPSFSRIAAILIAFSYGCLSGWSAGVLRAFVSGLLRSLAPALRRRYHSLAGLGASGLAVAWAIPFPLKNTGFLLSFTGAAGAWLGWVYAEAAAYAIRSSGFRSRSGNDSLVIESERYLQPSGRRTVGPAAPRAFEARAKTCRFAVTVLRPMTLCMVLFPVMARCFTEVSPASFFLSGIWGSLAALMIPAAAVTSFVPPLGALFGWFTHILLRGVRIVSKAVAGAPLTSVTMPAPSTLEIAAYWALLAAPLASDGILGAARGDEDALVFFHRRRITSTLRRVVILGSTALLIVSAVLRVYAFLPEVTFLYVGQGDCAVVRCGSTVMVVDTGTASSFDRHVLPYLRSKGITRVDMCVISHLHADHAGGLPALCAETTVGLVAVPPGFRDEVKALIGGAGTPPGSRLSAPSIVELHAGHRYRLGGAVLDVLLPEPGSYGVSEPQNESSVAFILNVGNMEVEFWGDSPSASIVAAMEDYRMVLEGGEGRSRKIVKVPHHGSPDAFVEALYRRASGGAAMSGRLTKDDPPEKALPEEASPGPSFGGGRAMEIISIISVGPNSYGHPSNLVEEAAKKGGKLLRLDETGAVTLKGAFGRVVMSTFLPLPDRRSGVPERKPERSRLETQFGGPE
jgi:competence protein ComEC